MATELPDRTYLEGLRRSLRYLFTRPWFFWPSIAVGAANGLLCVAAARDEIPLGIVLVLAVLGLIGSFFSFMLLWLPGFMLYRLVSMKPIAPVLDPGEATVIEIRAKHILGGEERSGKVSLTDQALRFTPHRFNIQLQPSRVAYADIRSLAWYRIVGRGGMITSHALLVRTDQTEEVFIVKDAEAVAGQIEAKLRVEATAGPRSVRREPQ
jgi:hypothetical protein